MAKFEHFDTVNLSWHPEQEIDIYLYDNEKINLDVDSEECTASVFLTPKETVHLIERLKASLIKIEANPLSKVDD